MIPISEKMPQTENWEQFSEITSCFHGDSQYLEATTDITNHLAVLVETTNTYEELKRELLEFTTERRAFVQYAQATLE